MRAPLLLCAVILAGCGGAESGREGSRPAPVSPAAASAAIVIERPLDGGRVRATATPDGRLRARVRVRGTTEPGVTVFLGASCRPRRCDARATAGDDGRWSVQMVLRTTRAAHFVTIDASAKGRVTSTGSAVTTVELAAAGGGGAAQRGGSAGDGSSGAGGGSSGGGSSGAGGGPPGGGAPRSRALPHDVLVIGDSLAVGMADALQAELPGWRVRTDGQISRPLAAGMRILAQEPDVPAIVAFSLFTNDDPSATGTLAQAVRATASRPGGCAVWATIVAPPYKGVSFDGANKLLERLAADPQLDLRIVDWAGLVARQPSLLEGDDVHATPNGYRVRARVYAAAIRACAGVE